MKYVYSSEFSKMFLILVLKILEMITPVAAGIKLLGTVPELSTFTASDKTVVFPGLLLNSYKSKLFSEPKSNVESILKKKC